MSKSVITSTVAFVLALTSATPSLAETSDCQKQLEAAVLKITTSGPMRAVNKTVAMRLDSSKTFEFSPPDRIRVTQMGELASEIAIETVIGGTIYRGDKKVIDGGPVEDPIYYDSSLSSFADPQYYKAQSRSAAEIKFENSISTLGNVPSVMRIDEQGRTASINYDEEGVQNDYTFT